MTALTLELPAERYAQLQPEAERAGRSVTTLSGGDTALPEAHAEMATRRMALAARRGSP